MNNNQYEFIQKGELKTKCKGAWDIDLTDEQIDSMIPKDNKLYKEQLKNMAETDIRWKQRLENFSKALDRLNEAAQIMEKELHFSEEVNDLLKEGLIQRFEYTHELAWNVMKDYAEYQGSTEIRGSRDAIR